MALPVPGDPESAFLPLVSVLPIATSTSRSVYAVTGHPDVVLKVAHANCETVNQNEVEVWNSANPAQQKALAKIHTWSANYTYVVMERLIPLTWGDLRVDQLDRNSLLSIITDFKPTNMGEALDGTIKMLDYAFRKAPPEASSFGGILGEE